MMFIMTTTFPTLASFFSAIKLTTDQEVAIAALEQFVADDTRHVFILRGYAGTGKTFLMKEVTRWLAARQYDLLLTAPTGRAAKVLQYSTGRAASTVHRAIYKFTSEDAQTMESRFDVSTRTVDEDAMPLAIIIDEASMLGDVTTDEVGGGNLGASYGSGRLMKDYLTHADFASHRGTKMIFVGDEAQLPPVGMQFSPALSRDYLFLEYGIEATEVVLRQVVRQADGSDLLATATAVRTALEAGNMPTRLPILQTSGQGGVRKLPTDQFADMYVKLNLKPMPTGQVVILAHTNEQVSGYNTAIRQHYFPQHTEGVSAGDILVVGHNVYGGARVLNNGETIRVVEVGHVREAHIKAPRGKIREAKGCMARFTHDEISARFVWRHLRAEVRTGTGAMEQFEVVLLENVLMEGGNDLSWAGSYLLRRDAQDRFYKQNAALYRSNKDEYEKRRAQFVHVDPYANALRCKFGYAITCHKAQGGEWKHVLADMRAFMQHLPDLREYYRWAYTAITRARQCAWLGFVEHQCRKVEGQAACAVCGKRTHKPQAAGAMASRHAHAPRTGVAAAGHISRPARPAQPHSTRPVKVIQMPWLDKALDKGGSAQPDTAGVPPADMGVG
jgi:AAA domain/UvrD-like helicase C-terminal domain